MVAVKQPLMSIMFAIHTWTHNTVIYVWVTGICTSAGVKPTVIKDAFFATKVPMNCFFFFFPRPANMIRTNDVSLLLPARIISGWFLSTEAGGRIRFLTKRSAQPCKGTLFSAQRCILLQSRPFPGSEWLGQGIIKKRLKESREKIIRHEWDQSWVALLTLKETEIEINQTTI